MWIAIALLVGFAVGFYVGRNPTRARAQVAAIEAKAVAIVEDARKNEAAGPKP